MKTFAKILAFSFCLLFVSQSGFSQNRLFGFGAAYPMNGNNMDQGVRLDFKFQTDLTSKLKLETGLTLAYNYFDLQYGLSTQDVRPYDWQHYNAYGYSIPVVVKLKINQTNFPKYKANLRFGYRFEHFTHTRLKGEYYDDDRIFTIVSFNSTLSDNWEELLLMHYVTIGMDWSFGVGNNNRVEFGVDAQTGFRKDDIRFARLPFLRGQSDAFRAFNVRPFVAFMFGKKTEKKTDAN